MSNETVQTTTTSSVSVSSLVSVVSVPIRRKVVFLHLDWGIGGAEQLMLQLCTATMVPPPPPPPPVNQNNSSTTTTNHNINQNCNTNNTTSIHLVTSHCDPHHCFELLHPKNGRYYPYLQIWGSFLPKQVFRRRRNGRNGSSGSSGGNGGIGTAVMSTIRLLYLAYMVARHPILSTADLIVLDVLPTPMWILYYLCPNAALLFYCHFPDQLLIRSHRNNDTEKTTSRWTRIKLFLFHYYRSLLNTIEEQSMTLADTITVNSKFTQATVRQTFPALQNNPLPILYPALEITTTPTSGSSSSTLYTKRTNLIVSLNRYERKKNLGLLIEAMAWIHQQEQPPSQDANNSNNTNSNNNIEVVIAGGYDKTNVENIEYRMELQQLAQRLHVPITFRQSISDTERNELLHSALMVVYTPSHEHFGIVPLESMYAKTPVIACHNGGPMETIVHETTGFLCAPTPESFGQAIQTLLHDPDRAIQMGKNGHTHVVQTFSPQQLQLKWEQLMTDTIQTHRQKQQQQQQSRYISLLYRVVSPRTVLFIMEWCIVVLFGIGCIYLVVQSISLLLLSGIRRGMFYNNSNDEL